MKRNYLTAFTIVVVFLVFSVTNTYASTLGTRIAGGDRYSTAVNVAASGWGSGASSVILATGENFPDALSAVTIAKKYNAPIILTTGETINTDAYNEIKALGAKTVYIAGGTGVVSDSIADSLKNLGITIERLSGSDRFETSVKIADKLGTVKEAFIATGEDFPDALSVAPIAAQKGIPILLVAKDNLPDSVKSYLKSNNITKTYVIGDTNVISSEVTSKLPNPEIIKGDTKYERNVNIINRFAADINFSNIYIATGENFPDALSGSALAAKNSSPIILVNSTPGTSTKDLLNKYADKITTLYILGGSGAVSGDTLGALGINDPAPKAASVDDTKAASGTFVSPSTSRLQDVFAKWMDTYSEGYFTGHMYPSIEAQEFAIKIYDQNMKPVGMSTKYEYAGQGFHEGLMAVVVIRDANFIGEVNKDPDHLDLTMSGRYGYIDPTGKEIIPDEYYGASDFKNGMAIVHKVEVGKLTTLVINKQNKVLFQEDGYFSGEIGDSYVYIEDGYKEPGYDEDGYNAALDVRMKTGSYYDYNWKRISLASRKGKSDEYGYWAANGDRINIPGYKSEMDVFSAKFGKLYEKVEYIGKGFFKVKELPPAGADADDYDVLNNLRNGVVDKGNNIIVPMGKYKDSEMYIVDTETSKLFKVKKDDGNYALYSGTGKEVLDAGTFTDFIYMGGGGIYYAKMNNLGWGAVTLDGKTIIPYSSKLLTTINYNNRWVHSIDGYVFSEPPSSNFVFYSTANMNEKADTTGLKALVAQAEAISKKYSTKGLSAAISDANSVIASENPRWIDISIAEIKLMDEARSANGYLTGKW